MVSNVTSCHAQPPEPPVPDALLARSAPALAGPAADSLVASHAYAAAVAGAAPTRVAAPTRTPSSAATGYAQATATGTTTTRTPTAKAPTTTKTTTAAKPTLPSALSFLNDKNLSVEEKLMRLLAYLNDRWDKDIETKMREIQNLTGSSAASSSGSSSSGSSGVLGSIKSFVKSVAGPALAATATAFGMPALAPAALQLGPSLVDSGFGLLSSATGAPASSSSSSSSSGDEVSSDRKTQVKLMEIQRITDVQKQWFEAVSKLLASRHDLRMGVIQNWK